MRRSVDLICPRCFAQRTRAASSCWRCGEPLESETTTPRVAEGAGQIDRGTTVRRRRGGLLLPAAVILALAMSLGGLWYARSTGYLPERAGGFARVTSRMIRAGVILGPPVSQRGDLTVVEDRIGMYAHDQGLVEVRVIEIDTSSFSTGDLLRAQLLDDGAHRWTTTRLGGIAYTCGSNRVSHWCFWSTSSHFGRVGTIGYPAPPTASMASLRRLAVALHDAVS